MQPVLVLICLKKMPLSYNKFFWRTKKVPLLLQISILIEDLLLSEDAQWFGDMNYTLNICKLTECWLFYH